MVGKLGLTFPPDRDTDVLENTEAETMRTGQNGTIRGTVHTPGPCAVQIRWYDAKDGRCLGRKRVYAGPFEVSVPAGAYFVEVEDERSAHDPSRFSSAIVAAAVTAGRVSEIDVHLSRDTSHVPAATAAAAPAPAGALQGRVVDGRDGRTPMEGAMVRLMDEDGRLVGRARTAADGHFAFENLATAAGLQVLVRPAPCTRDHSRLHLTQVAVADGEWSELGDLALPLQYRPRREARPTGAAIGTAAALSLPSTRV